MTTNNLLIFNSLGRFFSQFYIKTAEVTRGTLGEYASVKKWGEGGGRGHYILQRSEIEVTSSGRVMSFTFVLFSGEN